MHDDTAAAPVDYAAQTGTLTFAPGTTTQHITVGVAGDTTFEPTESFLVNLTTATNATILANEGLSSANGANTYVAYDGLNQIVLANQTIVAAGGSQPHDNMQPYLAISFIISLFGVYPSPWPALPAKHGGRHCAGRTSPQHKEQSDGPCRAERRQGHGADHRHP